MTLPDDSADGPVAPDVVVPDFPPDQDLLPPAPTSPAVHTVPFDQLVGDPLSSAPAPASPIDAAVAPRPAPGTAPAHRGVPAVPSVGQPRFSVPGLEHVVVEGVEPAPSGPVGYRTPARFAQHQVRAARTAPPIAAPVTPVAAAAPVLDGRAAGVVPPAGSTVPAPSHPAPALPGAAELPASEAPTVAAPVVGGPARTEPILQTGPDTATDASRKDEPATPRDRTVPRVRATPGAVLGAVAGIATIGTAAWWFTAPGTVHGVGLALGVLALVLSIVVLRDRTTTWQRPVALLGAVLGGVGTLVLLWAVAAALLPAAGVTLPDLTGSGTVPTLAP